VNSSRGAGTASYGTLDPDTTLYSASTNERRRLAEQLQADRGLPDRDVRAVCHYNPATKGWALPGATEEARTFSQ
jgi:hypothetical protein